MVKAIRSLAVWIVPLLTVWAIEGFVGSSIDPYFYTIIVYSGINVILAVSLNLVNGFTGQFSMGHAGFMAVGGYASAVVTNLVRASNPEWIHNPMISPFIFLAALCVGGLLSAGVGYLVGLPSLRLKGDYLAIVTLGFGEIIRVLILNINYLGAARGMPDIVPLSNLGWTYSFVIFTIFVVWRIVNSSHGRGFLAVREDEIAAESMGVHTTRAKVRAFILAAFFAGVAGGLFAHFLRFLSPSIFDLNRSFEIIIMVVLGGMGSISGSVVAAVFLTVIKEALRPLQEITKLDFRMVIFSLILIFLMLTRPNGIFGTREVSDFLPDSLRRKLKLRDRVM